MSELHWLLAVFDLKYLGESMKDNKCHMVYYGFSDTARTLWMRESASLTERTVAREILRLAAPMEEKP